MRKYQIQVTETLQKIFDVEAENLSEAKAIIRKQYNNEEIVLDYNHFVCVEVDALIDFCTTRQLIDRLQTNDSKLFEVNLHHNGINITHNMYYKNGNIYDNGLDQKTIKWKVDDFFSHYNCSHWTIHCMDNEYV